MAARKTDPGGHDKSSSDFPVPSSARTRSSGPAPSLTAGSGRVRDALASIRNFDALMRTPSVDEDTLASVMAEIGGACATLRDAFLQTPATYDALAGYALKRVDELDALLLRGVPPKEERVALGDGFVTRASADLAAAAELLDLAERSQQPAQVELALSRLAHESLQMVLAIHTEAHAFVRVDASGSDAVVVCDPQIASRLIALAVSMAYRPDGPDLLVKTQVVGKQATITVGSQDAPQSPRVAFRILRLIEPTLAVAKRAASAVGMTLSKDGDAIVITLPIGE